MSAHSLFARRVTTVTACVATAGLLVAGLSAPAIAAEGDFVSVVGIGSDGYSQLTDLGAAIGDASVKDIALSNEEILILRGDDTVVKSQVQSGGPDLAAFNSLIGDHEVIDLEAGYTGVLALLDDGTVVGRPGFPNGSVVTDAAAALGGKIATQITLGRNTAAALTDDGDVVVWGSDYQGAVSDRPNAAIDGNAVQVDFGWTHAVVRLEDGTVTGWGNNVSSQVSGAAAALGENHAVDVAASVATSFALLDTGDIVAWGSNAAAIATLVNAQTGDRTIADIDAGATSLAVLYTDGTAIGIDTFTAALQPELETAIAGNRVTQVVSGDTNTIASVVQPVVEFTIAEESPADVIAAAGDVIYVSGYDFLGDRNFSIDFDSTQLVAETTTIDGFVSWDVTIPENATKGAHTISLTVDGETYEQTVTVGATLAGSVPMISGTATVGSTLSATRGAWTPGATFTYAWLRNGKTISGATTSTYEIVPADLGSQLQVKVTGAKAGSANLAKSSAKTAKVAAGALTTGEIAITGTLAVGETLTATTGEWGPVTPKLSYQWYANGKPISKATKSTLVLAGSVVDKRISVIVTGKATGYTTATSWREADDFVVRSALNIGSFWIDGSPAVGKTLSVARSVDSNVTPSVTLEYQWMRSGSPIVGATKSTYKTTKADIGQYVQVRIFASKTGYFPTSTWTYYEEIYAKSVKAGTVKITGTAKVGKTLTVTVTNPASAGLYYYWVKKKGNVVEDVANGTPTYTLQESDKGFTIQVQAYYYANGLAYTPVYSKFTATVK
jgi:hypothetical protein